jgi:hypothetical protein
MVAQQQINAELLIIPDKGVPSEVVLIARRTASKGGLGIYCSSDGGKTYRSMIPAPGVNTRKGAILTIVDDLGNADWRLPPPSTPAPAILSGQRQYVPFHLAGDLSSGAVFGYLKIPQKRSATLVELQISMQSAADQDVTVDLINGSSVPQNRVATLAAGSYVSTTILETPLELKSGTVWRMKITGCGTGSAPGEFINVIAGIEYNL